MPGVRTLGVQRLLGGQVAGLFAEEPPLKEPCRPGRHHTDALFLRQGARIAEQFLDTLSENAKRYEREKANFYAKYKQYIDNYDPYYNPHFNNLFENFGLK